MGSPTLHLSWDISTVPISFCHFKFYSLSATVYLINNYSHLLFWHSLVHSARAHIQQSNITFAKHFHRKLNCFRIVEYDIMVVAILRKINADNTIDAYSRFANKQIWIKIIFFPKKRSHIRWVFPRLLHITNT